MDLLWWLRMQVTKLGKRLQRFIDEQAEKVCMPIQHGNSVRVKNYVIRKNPHGYLLYDINANKQVTTTFTKTAALALAKQLADDPKNSIKHIVDTDESIQNKYNECIFYKYTMTTTDDDIKREVTKIRYDIVWEDLLKLRDTLDNYIFDK